MDRNKLLISFLLIIISLVWAGSFIAVKTTVEIDNVPPIHLGFLRFLIASPFMVLILLFRKNTKKIPLQELPRLILLGLTGVTLIYILQYMGVDLTNASTAGVLINTNVIFILTLSIIFLKEKLTISKTAGITISFLGVIMVVFAQSMNETINFTDMFLLGSIYVILSAFCWAVYTIIGKKLLEKYDQFTVTAYAFLLGTFFFLPLVFQSISTTVAHISMNGWISILYLSLVCAVFGYLGWYYALTKTEASKAAVYLNFIPLFVITLSFFYGETPTVLFILGAILIIYGVYLTQRSNPK